MFSANNLYFCVILLISIISNAKLDPCPDVEKLKIVPGIGWDALIDNETKKLIKFSYDQCQLTSNGKFIIPDNTVSVPLEIQTKHVEAEIFEHWSDYTALSSAGFRVATDVWPEQFLPLYYSFSDEYQEMKNIQVKNKTFTCRSQIRQLIYRINLTSNAPIVEAVKERFQQVIGALAENNSNKARQLTQIIIRDYGTHYTKSVDVGMIFAMEHHLKDVFFFKHANNKSKILLASKLSLLAYIDDTGFSLADNQEHVDSALLNEYIEATLKKKIRFSSGVNWEGGANSEFLVAIDRSGDVLTSLVTSANFPEVSPAMLNNARQMFSDVIRNYYTQNIHRGCTLPSSNNFDFAANLDDGSCNSTSSDYIFGGGFVTFKRNPPKAGDYQKQKVNPLTGTFSCPRNFQSQLFYSYYACLVNENYVWNLFSCTAMGNYSVGPSYLFGGYYSYTDNNIQTNNKSCPQFYTDLDLNLGGRTLCYSDNELAKQYALPFGGFATVDTDYQCPNNYKKHFASPVGIAISALGHDIVNHGKIYYCLKEQRVKNMDVVPSLIRFPFE